jgi:Icc-related predicted phosphoesterase
VKIWLFSDLHFEFEKWLRPLARKLPDADVCVVPGDVLNGCANSVEYLARELAGRMPVIFVPGNHEFYNDSIVEGLEYGRRAAAAHPDFHFLEDDLAVVGGVRFVGATLWTDYALDGAVQKAWAMQAGADQMSDHRVIRLQDNPPRRSFMPADALDIHRRSRAFLEQALALPFDGPTVVVTHHAPHPGSIHPRFKGDGLNPCFASDLSEVLDRWKPELWVHGHMHNSADYRVGETRVVCNPLGYRGENLQFNPHLVLEV